MLLHTWCYFGTEGNNARLWSLHLPAYLRTKPKQSSHSNGGEGRKRINAEEGEWHSVSLNPAHTATGERRGEEREKGTRINLAALIWHTARLCLALCMCFLTPPSTLPDNNLSSSLQINLFLLLESSYSWQISHDPDQKLDWAGNFAHTLQLPLHFAHTQETHRGKEEERGMQHGFYLQSTWASPHLPLTSTFSFFNQLCEETWMIISNNNLLISVFQMQPKISIKIFDKLWSSSHNG